MSTHSHFLSLIVYFGIGEKGNIEQHMFFLQCPTVFLRFIHTAKNTFFFLNSSVTLKIFM